MYAADLLLSLRVAIRLGKTKLALRITVAIEQCTRLPLSHVSSLLGRCLLEDKFPEAQRYFKAFQEMHSQMNLKDRNHKLTAYLLPAVYSISKLPQDSTPFQMAFMKMCGREIANKKVSDIIDSTILVDIRGDKIFLSKKPGRPPKMHVWSKDVVIQRVWSILMANKPYLEPRGFPQLPTAYKNLPPVTEDELLLKEALYGEEKVKGFKKEMSQYIAKYGNKHFYSEPVLLSIRHQLRYEKVFPAMCENTLIRRLERVKDGWFVEWQTKKYKLSLPKRSDKKTFNHVKKSYSKKGEDKVYDIKRPRDIAIKWKDCVMFMSEQVEGEDVTVELLREHRGMGFEVMKTLVYRYVKGLHTYWRDLQVVDEKIYSVNESKSKTVVVKRQGDVWLNMVKNKKSVKVKECVDELKEYLRSFGTKAFKDYMEKIKQEKLYEKIMETLETP